MVEFLPGWRLRRSPLAPSVPLEGSETVQGLRTLERLLTANRAAQNGGTTDGIGTSGSQHGSAADFSSRRRRYQRYRGPFLEHLTIDDLKKDPRPWKQFAAVEGSRWTTLDYSIPATLDFMCERVEENLMQYVANYVRIFIMVILLTMYLRPKAILGVAAIVFSAIHHLRRINRMQRVERAAERAVENGHIGNNINSIMTLVVWVIVVYTKCTPILFLGFILASLTILTHAAVRQSPTEARYRGRVVLSYSFAQMFGRQSVPEGNDTWLVFKQLWRMWVLYMAALMVMARRWVVFYTLALWDVMRKPFVPALRSEIPSGWS